MRTLLPLLLLSLAACGPSDDVAPASPSTVNDADGDGATASVDCDDDDAGVSPGRPDLVGDGVDANCDGHDGVDADGDGHASEASGGDDCDDDASSTFPTAAEVPYDGVDQDCDGADLVDVDGDGFVGAPAGGDDCDDTDAARFPGAPETCNGRIDDCTLPRPEESDVGRVIATDASGAHVDVTDDFRGAYEVVHPYLVVCGGTHEVSLDITVTSEIEGFDGATLDGRDAGRLVELSAGQITLRGLTLTRGFDRHGPAVHAPRGGSVELHDCDVQSNTFPDDFGTAGVVHVVGGELSVEDTHFQDNGERPIYVQDGTLEVQGSSFIDNHGAIYLWEGGPHVVEGSSFDANRYTEITWKGPSDLTVRNNTFVADDPYGYRVVFLSSDPGPTTLHFEGNTATGYSTALYLPFSEDEGQVDVVIADSTLEDGIDGAVFIERGTLSVTGSTFRNNTNGYGGAIEGELIGDVLFEDTLFEGNSAAFEGGAVWIREVGFEPSPSVICRATGPGTYGFVDNTAPEAAALYLLNGLRSRTLVSEGCDWGEGSSDNIADPAQSEIELAGGFGGYTAGDDATFTCTEYACE